HSVTGPQTDARPTFPTPGRLRLRAHQRRGYPGRYHPTGKRNPGAAMRSRTPAALLLAGLLAVAADGRQPAAQPPTPPGAAPRDMAKGAPTKLKEPEWPKDIEGKDVRAVLNAIEKELDPQGREVALRMLPLFGPPGQKV